MCRYEFYNPNPTGKKTGDCTVRALCKALKQNWVFTFLGLAVQGAVMGDMPSANSVWGAYLRRNGFTRRAIPDTCPDCYTARDFALSHPRGTFILAFPAHVVCMVDGTVYDTWDSRDETPVYFWERTEQ